jgi:DNA-binding CsgD family transcriptional regulator
MHGVMPLVVVEGLETAWRLAVNEVEAAGWRVEPGFAPPFRAGRIVRTGPVALGRDARAALHAALEGQGLVVHGIARPDILHRLVDDLRRLGPVDHRVARETTPTSIDPVALSLLGLLAEGHSLGQAAATLGLSRRTADRRLAEGRAMLGTRRTTEAIARAARMGWLAKADAKGD